jgi:ankyrin repeat protein
MLASEGGHSEAVSFLLRNGAVCNDRDRYGRTALMFAVQACGLQSTMELLAAGADPNACDNHGVSVSDYICTITGEAIGMKADQVHIKRELEKVRTRSK